MPAVNVFISYRRDDAAGHAGRIFDKLDDRFPGAVFMDVAGLGPGVNFVRAIEQKLNNCHLLIVVIGRSWLSIMHERAARPEEPDYARIEVATALRNGIPVIPLLVHGARMPRRSDLPDDLKALNDHHAMEITEPDFRSDVRRLIEAIEGMYPQPPRPPHGPRPKPAGLPFWLKLSFGLGAAAVVGVFGLIILYAVWGQADPTTDVGGGEGPGDRDFSAPPPYAFNPAGRWAVSRQDAQQLVFVLTLGGDGALVQFPASTQAGTWNYDENMRTVTVYAPDGSVMISLRVAEWHQDHFHGQWFTAGGPMGVNIRPG